MPADTRDILIVGAGCAGLSLAVALVDAGVTDRRIVLLDGRTQYTRDRTWCYWDVPGRHPFETCVSRRWHRWTVGDTTAGDGTVAYCHLPADRFYAAALDRLGRHPNVDLRLGCGVSAVRDDGNTVTAVTAAGPVRGGLAFDSRPTPPLARPGDVTFRQQFVGLFVRTARPTFDPAVVRLMDFRVPQAGGIRFVYLLPFSPTEALVEATAIAEQPDPDLDETARHYLSGIDYVVTAREHGRLPMTTAPTPVRRSARVYAIGLAGGLAKPSTGYAFAAIQRWSAAMAAAVANGSDPTAPPPVRSAKATLLDRVFLSYLRSHPAAAPTLFAELFARVPPAALARFLSDAGTLADDLRVIAALPKLPFIAEAIRSRRLWMPSFSRTGNCPSDEPATTGRTVSPSHAAACQPPFCPSERGDRTHDGGVGGATSQQLAYPPQRGPAPQFAHTSTAAVALSSAETPRPRRA